MSRIIIPTQKDWKGIFKGDYFGHIWLGKQINLERSKGKIGIGDSMTSIFDSDDDVDVGIPIAFAQTAADGTDRWWALAGSVLFKSTNTNPESTWAQDAIASSPTAAENDMIEFLDALLVSTDTNISRLSTSWTANWWTSLSGTAAMTSSPHRFGVHAGAVLITDGRFINSYDGTVAKDPALSLPADFQSEWVRSIGDYAAIGTSIVGNKGEADMFFWDRAASTFNARYGIGDTSALCGFLTTRGFYIITKKGYIKKFTGNGFDTVQQFPTAEAADVITDIHPNGVAVDGDVVRILVRMNTESTSYLSHRTPSGLWTFEPATNNLYHFASPTNNSGLDYSQQELAGVGAVTLTTVSQGRLLIGAKTYKNYAGTDNTTRRLNGIFTLDEEATSGRGWFITPKIPSQNVRAFFRELFIRFERFLASTDRIRLAYRIQESLTLPAYETITWATSTTFTGTNADVAANDFVEILAGDNAGAIAKISSITGSPTRTFTIDLTLNASTKDARARYWPFIDLGTISSQSIQKEVFRIARRSTWVQYLVELRGTELSPQIEEMILDFDELQF